MRPATATPNRLTNARGRVGTALVNETLTYRSISQWNLDHWNAGPISEFGAYADTTIGCMAVAPVPAVVDRPLTIREAHVLFAPCLLPVVGGWLVNETYNNHVLTAPDEVGPVAAPRRYRHKM